MSAADLAARLGLREQMHDWRGDCPVCGYKNGFSIRRGRSGNALWSCFGGCDRDVVTEALRNVSGGTWEPPTDRSRHSNERQHLDRIRRATHVWEAAARAKGSLVASYLASRGLPDLAASDALKFAPCASHPQGAPGLPAMIARVQNVDGDTVGVHRTYLRRDGAAKADIEPAKASLGLIWGGAIRLQPHQPGIALIVGEGIESAASAGVLAGLPAWAAISAGNLGGGLVLPADVRDVIIAADPDKVGEARAVEAARRWQREGRAVRIARTRIAGDWNDLLMREVGRV